MSNWKYATIRKGEHTQGRIHMGIHMNKREKTLTIDLKRAQDLNAEPNEESNKGLSLHCRVQVLQNCTNATESARVYDSLFTMQEVEDSRFKRSSSKHKATNCPAINESYTFPLASIWGNKLKALRLYVAVVADEVVCSDGTGCVGCMSFSMEDLANKKGQWPDQFWLLSQTEGLYTFEEVKKQVTFDAENASLTHIVIGGRVRANLSINGTYFCQGTKMYKRRYVYKHESSGLWLSFHAGRNCWIIADKVGSNAPLAYVEDDASTPDLAAIRAVDPSSVKTWMVFSRERRFVEGAGADDGSASFESDENVRASVAQASDLMSNVQNEDSPAFDASIVDQGRVSIAAKVKQANYFAGKTADPLLVPPTKPLSKKAKAIVRVIASEQQYLETLRNLNIVRQTMFSENDANAFAVIPQMMNASQLTLEELRIAQSHDPNLERPIGLLMVDLFPAQAEPMLDYCTALDIKVQQVGISLKRLIGASLEVSEATRDALSALGGIAGIIEALTSPFKQVQRYPYFVRAIQDESPDHDRDHGPLFIAWQKFHDLSLQVQKVAGKLELNTKPKPKPNKLPPPLVEVVPGGTDELFKHPYYHGEIPRSKVVDLYNISGSDGWFLMRKLPNEKKYILSYCAEGRLVHQPVAMTADGKFELGREFNNLNSLVVYYGSPRTNLVGPITQPCPRK